jgi:SAM-dependent methyltransferase
VLGKHGSMRPADAEYPRYVAYQPELVPPPVLMASEGIKVLEEWFRWGEEWAVVLRAYAGLGRDSAVMEIGCGLGRIAFSLRYFLDQGGSYEGFEIVRAKIDFLKQRFEPAHRHFRFTWADVRNTHYNPGGKHSAADYRFPYPDKSFDVVFAASVFTHMTPENVAHYFREAGRVLRPGGRCLFSFFLLDNYRPRDQRPPGFNVPDFDFTHPYGAASEGCSVAFPADPERMTAYRTVALERLASDAGLRLAMNPLPGYWSGAAHYIGAQDLVVLAK